MEDKIRLLVESCDSIDCFMINHSISGGTGSGFTSRLLSAMS